MSEYQLITAAKNYHSDLINENRIVEETYQGITVYKINPDIKGKNGEVNSNGYYFYSVSTIPKYNNGTISSESLKEAIKPENKKGICLHYTAGQIRGDLPWLTGQINKENPRKNQDVSVPFMICPAGFIYQLCNPDTDLAWHLSPSYKKTSTWHLHNQIIGIELCNWGHLINRVPDKNHIITLSKKHRGQDRFEKFTDEQYISLNRLIDAICRRYTQIKGKILDEDKRYDYFGVNDTKWEELISWRGISSHINYNKEKFDIGPAFDWDRIVRPALSHPLIKGRDDEIILPSAQWYANTEIQQDGGYFPIGTNRALHSGVHVFSREAVEKVNAMAPGEVIAFRFFTEEEQKKHAAAAAKIGLRHNGSGNFVLLRHKIAFKLNEKDEEEYFYSLYMDLKNPSEAEIANIPWLRKLKNLNSGSSIDISYNKAGEITPFPEKQSGYTDKHIHPAKEFAGIVFDNLKIQVEKDGNASPEKAITCSKPVFSVGAGEVIGYTGKYGYGKTQFHWEVFCSKEADVFKKIADSNNIRGFNFTDVSNEAEDGIFDKDEVGKYFTNSSLQEWLGSLYNSVTQKDFKKIMAEHYASGKGDYEFSFSVKGPEKLRLKPEIKATVKAYGNRRELPLTLSRHNIKIGTLDNTSGIIEEPRIEIPINDLCKHTYTISANQFVDTIEIRTPPMMELVSTSADEQEELFVELAKKGKLMRDSLFNAASPWTANHWEQVITKLKEKRYRVPADYTFKKEDFIPYTIFDKDLEYPAYASIYEGTKGINPQGEFCYVHPVSFLWLLSIPKNNGLRFVSEEGFREVNILKRYGFIKKNAGDAGIAPGDEVKVLFVAEHERYGQPDPETVNLPGQALDVSLSRNGVCVKQLNTNYWGSYTVSGMAAISDLTGAFTIDKPELETPVLSTTDNIKGSINVPFKKRLPREIFPVMKFKYEIKGRSGAQKKELDFGLLLSSTVQAADTSFTCNYDLEAIFEKVKELDGELQGEEELSLEYTIVLYNAMKDEMLAAAENKSSITDNSLKTGKHLVSLSKLSMENSEAASYQVINLLAFKSPFEKKALGFTYRKGNDDLYRIGNGIGFLPAVSIDDYEKPEDHFLAVIKITGDVTEEIKQEEKELVHLKIQDRKLFCLIKPVDKYFDGDNSLEIIFKNKKGPRRMYEAKTKIIHPIKEVKAEYVEKQGSADSVTCTVSLNENAYPPDCSQFNVILDWYYTSVEMTDPDTKKSWKKIIGPYSPANNTVSFTVPLGEMRGNSFFVSLAAPANQSIIGKESKHCVIGKIPEDTCFDGLMEIIGGKNNHKIIKPRELVEKDKEMVLKVIQSAAPGSSADIVLPNNTLIWKLFDSDKKEIVFKESEDTSLTFAEFMHNGEYKRGYFYNSRFAKK